MFGPCFVMQYFVSFLVLQSYRRGRERERELFALLHFSFCLHVAVSVSCLFSWYRGLVCSEFVIVAFPSHTHLFHQRVIVVITTKF